MAFVWRHPSLTAIELLWRWLAAAPLLWLAWRTLAPALIAVPLDTAALQSMTFFEPVRSAAVLVGQMRLYLPALERTGKWWVALALLVWTLAATVGRTAVLLRADPAVAARRGRMALASLLRAMAFLLVLFCWVRALAEAVHRTVIGPGRAGAEPNLVLLAALFVLLTLVFFLAWSVTVWVLDLLPLPSMTGLLPTPAQRVELRSKLMETNLVLGIVRVILFVLAMTFSASPLPFQSHETQSYINVWWTGVAVFFILASDFFHVVRRVAYLRLLKTIASGDPH